jgi:peptide-methionine (S)-S-oxide reductase
MCFSQGNQSLKAFEIITLSLYLYSKPLYIFTMKQHTRLFLLLLLIQGGPYVEAQSIYEEIVLGGGCFWCLEAVYEKINGVLDVVSGYAGGTTPNPTYEQVCSGTTGHAEVVRVRYDPRLITEAQILDWFWKAHDPTTLNRQGADVGTQYRSILFYKDSAQKSRFEQSRNAAQRLFDRPIVTEIVSLTAFYTAEAYHQDYFRNNPNVGYCRFVITPKLNKLNLR